MARIKLCGMMTKEDIETANRLKPDYVGFIFWEKSFRNLSKEQARELKQCLDPSIDAVGVFVDADLHFISELVREHIIHMVQLHGSEDENYIRTLKKILPIGTQIIKAFKVTTREEVKEACECMADYILFDPGKGSGNTFDWDLIKDVERPFFLAGGLNCDNVKDAIDYLDPLCVDVSSGIETDKKKDPEKMERFVSIVRSL